MKQNVVTVNASMGRNAWFFKRSKFVASRIGKDMSETASCRGSMDFQAEKWRDGMIYGQQRATESPRLWLVARKLVTAVLLFSLQQTVKYASLGVGVGWVEEALRVWVDVCSYELATPKTPMPQSHENGKALPGWGSGKCQGFPPGPLVDTGRKYLWKLCQPTPSQCLGPEDCSLG